MKKRSIWLAALCLALVPPVQAQTPAGTRPKVSVSFNAVPFRDALGMLFKNSGLQYSIDANVPNSPVNLSLRDVSLEQALRLLVRSMNVPDLATRKEGDVYVIKVERSGHANHDLVFAKIPVQFQRAEHVLGKLLNTKVLPNGSAELAPGRSLMPEGVVAIHPSSTENALLVRGIPDGIEMLKNLVRLIDIPERTLVLTVGVTGPGIGGKPLRIQSSARTLNGRSVMIDEEVPNGTQKTRLKVRLEPFVRGDNAIHVDADWDVTVSVPGARGEVIRLVKRFQSSTALQPGIGVAVSTVDLSAWGGTGHVRFWLRGQPVSTIARSLEGPAGERIPDRVRLLGEIPHLPVGALALGRPAEIVRKGEGYELIRRDKSLPDTVVAEAARPRTAGTFPLFAGGRLLSERMVFVVEDFPRAGLVADPGGEPYIPLADVARALGGKLEFEPILDTYRIVDGRGLATLIVRDSGRR